MTEMPGGVHCPQRRLDRCLYTCRQCGLRFTQYIQMRQHRIRRHSLECFANTVKLKRYRSWQTHGILRRTRQGRGVSSRVSNSTSDEITQGHDRMCELVLSPGSRDSGIDEASPSYRGDETNSDNSPVHHMTDIDVRKLPNNIGIASEQAYTSHDDANNEPDRESMASERDMAAADLTDIPCPDLVATLTCEQYGDVPRMPSASLLCDWELAQHDHSRDASLSAITMTTVHSEATCIAETTFHSSTTEPLLCLSGGSETCITTCDNNSADAYFSVQHLSSDTVKRSPLQSDASMVIGAHSCDEDSNTVSYGYDEGCGNLSDFDTETSDNAAPGCGESAVPCPSSFFDTVITGEPGNILVDVNGNAQCLVCPKHGCNDCKLCSEASYGHRVCNTNSMAMLPLTNGVDPQLPACSESDLSLVQSQELQCAGDALMPSHALSGIDSFSCVGDSSSIRLADLGQDLLASASNAALPQLECFQFDDRDAWMSHDEDSAPTAVPMFYIGENSDSATTSNDHPQIEFDSMQATKGSDEGQSRTGFVNEFCKFLKRRNTKPLTRCASISHVKNKHVTKPLTRCASISHVKNKHVTEVDDEYSPVNKSRHSCADSESYNLRPKRRKSTQCDCCMVSESAETFRAKTFVRYQLQVNSLRQKVVQLFEVLFPHLEYPHKFSPDSPTVETLMDKVMAIVEDRDPAVHPKKDLASGGHCWVVLCRSPSRCLRLLRRKVRHMLEVLLPDLKSDGSFERQSIGVEQLLQEVIASNLANPKTT